MAAVGDLEMTAGGGLRMRGQAAPKLLPEEDSYLMLERDLLEPADYRRAWAQGGFA